MRTAPCILAQLLAPKDSYESCLDIQTTSSSIVHRHRRRADAAVPAAEHCRPTRSLVDSSARTRSEFQLDHLLHANLLNELADVVTVSDQEYKEVIEKYEEFLEQPLTDFVDTAPDQGCSATVATRLYLPAIQTVRTPSGSESAGGGTTKLPILVFFHGGFFIVGSSRDPNFHRYVTSLVANARVVAVFVDYRLAPEHPLPAAYDDSWAALNWALSGADPWLSDHGDLGRVFVGGASAGANIAHNMAVAAGMNGLQAAPRIEGVILLHPSFCGEQRLEGEAKEFWEANKKRWAVIFPSACNGSDDPRINPMAAAAGAGAPGLAKLAGEKLFVSTASEDPRAPRGRAYCDAVRTGGWTGKVQWFETKGKGHCFFVDDCGSHEAVALMDRVAAFIAGQ